MDLANERRDEEADTRKTDVVITEGEAEILVSGQSVFYNPVQEFNRDLSIAVLSLFAETWKSEETAKKEQKKKKGQKKEGTDATEEKFIFSTEPDVGESGQKEGIVVLEALSATGLRGIRYAKEVKGIKRIIANDISANAVNVIRRNVAHNHVEDLVFPSHEDATMLMYQHRKDRTFHAIDLDPYGCPSIFLDGAVQSIGEGGLLLITATDTAVLAGIAPETCYVKYGAISLKSKACHEMALRILLQHVASHAGRYGRYIVPLLSVSVDFYIRVFLRVFTSPKKCKENTSKLGLVYQCVGCESFHIQPLGAINASGGYKLPVAPVVDQLCKFCNHKHHVGGPIWLGSIHDQQFVSQLLHHLEEDDLALNTTKRIEGVLSVIHEELDLPLYYTLDRLMSIIRCFTPPMVTFRSAILNAGYDVSYSHANKISIKTNAPNEVIWDIVRAWEKEHPVKREKLEEKCTAGLAILNQETKTKVSFEIHPNANPDSRKKHLSRFQKNPTPNWGPGTRSTIMGPESNKFTKRTKNQNKNGKNEEVVASKVDGKVPIPPKRIKKDKHDS